MGQWNPTQAQKSLLTSVVIATGAAGNGSSAVIAPAGPTKWTITGFSAVAPGGTNGALMFYKHSVAAANLLAVMGIGENTSEDLNLPFQLDSGGANDLIVNAQGIPQLAGNTVTVNLIGAAY